MLTSYKYTFTSTSRIKLTPHSDCRQYCSLSRNPFCSISTKCRPVLSRNDRRRKAPHYPSVLLRCLWPSASAYRNLCLWKHCYWRIVWGSRCLRTAESARRWWDRTSKCLKWKKKLFFICTRKWSYTITWRDFVAWRNAILYYRRPVTRSISGIVNCLCVGGRLPPMADAHIKRNVLICRRLLLIVPRRWVLLLLIEHLRDLRIRFSGVFRQTRSTIPLPFCCKLLFVTILFTAVFYNINKNK